MSMTDTRPSALTAPAVPATPATRGGLATLALGLPLLLGACAAVEVVAPPPPEGPARKEFIVAVTSGNELVRFNAGQPGRILSRAPLQGLAAGDAVVGIDFRVARGVLYALTRSGRLYTVDTAAARLAPVGAGTPIATALQGTHTGFDFNPTVDRIRVVGDGGQNLRLHPDTGALVQADGNLAYAEGDTHFGKAPQVAAAAYTYNKQNDKITTNFAIDRGLGTLVVQGSFEGVQPAVSPNTGRLSTVGSLGLGALDDVSFDIADVDNTAFASVRVAGARRTLFVRVDLASGRAQTLGTVGDGLALVGMAIEP